MIGLSVTKRGGRVMVPTGEEGEEILLRRALVFKSFFAERSKNIARKERRREDLK